MVTNLFDPFGIGKFWSDAWGLTDVQESMLRAQSKIWESYGKYNSKYVDMMLSQLRVYSPALAESVEKSISGNAAYLRAKDVNASVIAGVARVNGKDPAEASRAFREDTMIAAWSGGIGGELTMRLIGSVYPGRGEADDLYKKYNGKMLVRNSGKPDAGLDETNWRNLRAMFDKKYDDGHDWPHLVLTSNHAYADTSSDMTDLMQGAEALIKHAFPADRLPTPPKLLYGTNPSDAKNGITVVGVCQTRRNSYLNGADLIERLSYRKKELMKAESGRDSEYAVRNVQSPSFAARRLAKTILILLAENPEALDPNEPLVLPSDREVSNQEPEINKLLKETKIKPDTPIQLRSDAAEVARHIKLFGYSLGANNVSDAMRLVVRELTAKIPGKNVGRFTIASNPEEAATPLVGGEIGDKKFMVSDIVSRIGVLTVAPGEKPMSQAHKDWGIRRINIINEKDNIASHFWNDTPQWKNPYILHDNLLKFNGDFASLGHSPKSALGTTDTPGLLYTKNGKSGLPPVVDRLQGFWAPVLGKAAIADIRFKNLDGNAAVVIEPSSGTGRGFLAKRAEQIGEALNQALDTSNEKIKAKYGALKVVHHPERGEFEIIPHGGTHTDAGALAADNGVLKVVTNAMKSLKEDKSNGLFVSQAVFEDLQHHQRNLSGRGHSGTDS